MNLYSRRIPLILIDVLVCILVVQYVVNAPEADRLIDPVTCEIYASDLPGGERTYLGEFDPKCLEIREILNP